MSVEQSGTITPGHIASWFTNGVIIALLLTATITSASALLFGGALTSFGFLTGSGASDFVLDDVSGKLYAS